MVHFVHFAEADLIHSKSLGCRCVKHNEHENTWNIFFYCVCTFVCFVAALEGSGDFGSGDSLLSDDEDDVVLNDQGDMGDDEEYDDEDDDDDSYLS